MSGGKAHPEITEEAVLEAVRQASRQNRAVSAGEVVSLLAGRPGEAPALEDEAPASSLEQVERILGAAADLASFEGAGGERLYHDPALVSGAYARIMDRKGRPLLLMAEEIRANSREYPRPVPVELFEAPPFDLSREAIEQALQAMAASPDFADITFTTTASGAVYLFSLQSLDRRYACFLAEHLENQAMNP